LKRKRDPFFWKPLTAVVTKTRPAASKGCSPRNEQKENEMLKLKVCALNAGMILALITIVKPMAAAADGPTDPQIVGIVLAADQIDIDYGKIALSKSKNKQVREFAQRMVTDHSAVQKSVIGLADKLGVKAEDSSTSTGLKSKAADITAKLNSLKGKEFDKFYIDNEVSYHKTVTDAVDAVLIPSAQNAELKAALQGAQPLFLKHLEQDRSVQSGSSAGMDH
jgi:putative membrane protein